MEGEIVKTQKGDPGISRKKRGVNKGQTLKFQRRRPHRPQRRKIKIKRDAPWKKGARTFPKTQIWWWRKRLKKRGP